MFGGSPKPPPPPPPAANPATFASSVFSPPQQNLGGVYAGLGNSILTGPLGAPDQRTTQRKSLFGQ